MLEFDQQNQIARLRFLIARAAQMDSLAWWEDNSLSPAGHYVLQRIFGFAPEVAGMQLAWLAAQNRHQRILGEHTNRLHLFSTEIASAPARSELHQLAQFMQPWEEIIESRQVLQTRLQEMIGELVPIKHKQPGSNGEMEIQLDDHLSEPSNIAAALAWGYTLGDKGQPVYPYVKAMDM